MKLLKRFEELLDKIVNSEERSKIRILVIFMCLSRVGNRMTRSYGKLTIRLRNTKINKPIGGRIIIRNKLNSRSYGSKIVST